MMQETACRFLSSANYAELGLLLRGAEFSALRCLLLLLGWDQTCNLRAARNLWSSLYSPENRHLLNAHNARLQQYLALLEYVADAVGYIDLPTLMSILI